ncbi:adenylate/guanylate cyclase domain-containing protein [Mycolicibacterium porcinum]|nr:adenylate/guanylate cyclase domain-containing protein [Mycolicibacterium porcinum]
MTSADEPVTRIETDNATKRKGPRRTTLSRVSIQSKLLLMLLLTSVLSAAVVGFIGYRSGRESLRDSVFERLTEIRESQARHLEATVGNLTNSMAVYTRGATAEDAMRAFTAGFAELGTANISPREQQSLVDRYAREFAPHGDGASGDDSEVDIDALLPSSTPQRYLQAHYTAPSTDRNAAVELADARDGSAWSAANARFNDYFATIVRKFEFGDALLIDTRGNVVYSAYKGVDLGTNILNGPYRASNLTGAYREALNSNSLDHVAITDFGDYRPSAEPAAWIVSPVGPAAGIQGVLAFQLPISKLNRVMTFDGKWEAAGLGTTGETVIVGPDGLMRSDARSFVENPDAYRRDVVAAGTPADVADRAIRQHGTTLVQPMATDAASLALQGRRGTLIARDYEGHTTLQAYAPVKLPGLNWTIVAKLDTAEAFAPVATFTRTLVLSTAVIIFVVCIAALLLARLFVRPVRQLEAGARRISAGDYDVTLPLISRDEFGDLTHAFNEMSRNLRIKEDLLNEQRRENDRLLLSLMPEQVVQRYREGEETIAQDHQDVTVIFADIAGLDALANNLSSDESVSIVNHLVRQFDAAASNLGVEKIRTLHNGYLASCGLNVPRLDNVRRTVDFAVEMQHIIDRFNGETGNHLRLRAGINTGTVTSGLVGRTSLAYDMWGAAVNLAYQVQSGFSEPGVYVTAKVFETIRDSRQFTAAGEITVDGRNEPVWRLSERE